MSECVHCMDTGNSPFTGWEHPGYDELGCQACDLPDGNCCCIAVPAKPAAHTAATAEDYVMADPVCRNCGHPVRRLQRGLVAHTHGPIFPGGHALILDRDEHGYVFRDPNDDRRGP